MICKIKSFFLASGLLLGLCCTLSAQAAPGRKLQILTTFPPIYSFAASVAGDLADVQCLLPSASGPHDYQLSPSDLRKIKNAQLVIMNGLGLENWLKKALDARQGELVLIECSAGLKDELIRGTALAIETGEGHDHHHDAAANPHIWLDPLLAKHAVTNITRALGKADPENAAAYGRNAEAYLLKLNALHQEILDKTRPLKDKAFITYHNAFPYFIRRYQLKLAGIIELAPDVPPPPKYLSKLIQVVRKENVRAIYTEPQFSPRLARRLGQDLNVPVAELDTLETGPAKAGMYEEGMRRNLQTLVRTLGR